jgi:predicted transcriptional regulator
MSQNDQDKKVKKEALKKLRNSRKEWITRAAAKVKEQKKTLKAIKGQLKEGVETVPRIAEATGIPADRVLWYIAALKKYGEISESEKDGGYFRYMLTSRGQEEDLNDQTDETPETI